MIFWGDNNILKAHKRCDNNLPLIFIHRPTYMSIPWWWWHISQHHSLVWPTFTPSYPVEPSYPTKHLCDDECNPCQGHSERESSTLTNGTSICGLPQDHEQTTGLPNVQEPINDFSYLIKLEPNLKRFHIFVQSSDQQDARDQVALYPTTDSILEVGGTTRVEALMDYNEEGIGRRSTSRTSNLS